MQVVMPLTGDCPDTHTAVFHWPTAPGDILRVAINGKQSQTEAW